ncbi:unnamed protein product [Urochloa humidicola]
MVVVVVVGGGGGEDEEGWWTGGCCGGDIASRCLHIRMDGGDLFIHPVPAQPRQNPAFPSLAHPAALSWTGLSLGPVGRLRDKKQPVLPIKGNSESTPRRPGKPVETYLFAMFNENQKAEGVEQHLGLFQPDMSEVYHVDFAAGSSS